jgi:hypothetical protein
LLERLPGSCVIALLAIERIAAQLAGFAGSDTGCTHAREWARLFRLRLAGRIALHDHPAATLR